MKTWKNKIQLIPLWLKWLIGLFFLQFFIQFFSPLAEIPSSFFLLFLVYTLLFPGNEIQPRALRWIKWIWWLELITSLILLLVKLSPSETIPYEIAKIPWHEIILTLFSAPALLIVLKKTPEKMAMIYPLYALISVLIPFFYPRVQAHWRIDLVLEVLAHAIFLYLCIQYRNKILSKA